MNVRLLKIRCFLLLLLVGNFAYSQDLPEYDMSDTTLTDCQGILYDSGGENGLYSNNSNIVTVINTGGIITLDFIGNFVVENNLDFLTIYDGVGTAGPLLGQFTGTTAPGSVVANSGAVTLVFTSDNSAVYGGFTIQWETEVPPPIPPDISVDVLPNCGDQLLQVDWSYALFCPWVDAATFTLTRNGEPIEILGVAPFCQTDSAEYAVLALGEAFEVNCTYEVVIEIEIPDACGTFYPFTLQTEFTVSDCGIQGEIVADEISICPTSCTQISFETINCLGVTYAWSNGLPATAGPHTVCPITTTTYTVTVTENETGVVEDFAITIEVLATSILTSDQVVCQSVDAFNLDAAVEGTWSGPGIQDDVTGLFEPDSAMAGLNIIYFESAGCLDSLEITIEPISTDDLVAACPGSAIFQLNAQPAGGTWSGDYTDAAGMFDPQLEGQYTAFYSVNGCTDSVLVNVFDITGSFTFDTICQSVWSDTLEFSPLGGYWVGPGIIDSLLGVFIPEDVPAGDATFTYFINGCQQEYTGFVKEIRIGDRFYSMCPEQDPALLYDTDFAPPGGYWEGAGLLDTQTGLFDPFLISDGTYTSIRYYAPNGCVDTTFIYVKQTAIGLDELFFCEGDDAFDLNDETVFNDPGYWGQWTGSGIVYLGDDHWQFSPGTSGVGNFTLTYTKNTCSDTMDVTVFPSDTGVEDFAICSNEPNIILGSGIPAGGTWSGGGVVNSQTGEFNAASTFEGERYVYWTTPAGCQDSILINVEIFEQAAVSVVDDFYCYKDSNYVLVAVPADGYFTGALSTDTINPYLLGEGSYTFQYIYEGVACNTSTEHSFGVYPPIQTEVTVSQPIVCDGNASTITVNASGGYPDLLFSYQWSDGGFPVNTHTINPESTTTISVITSDGCSEDVTDVVTIEVFPPIGFDVELSDTLCFGEIGFAQVIYDDPNGTYLSEWNGQEGEITSGTAGATLSLEITDLNNGCQADTVVFLPAYPPIIANFSINPNDDCLSFDDKENVQVIDFSQNAVSGTWFLGEGATQAYEVGVTPTLSYAGAGQFEISLVVENIGGCADTAYAQICILPADPLFIPDIFSPNGDGNNDVFYLRGNGIVEMDMMIYNRFGQRVFRSTNSKEGWNGDLGSKPSPSGNYVYTIYVKLADGSTQNLKGEVTLIR